MNTSFEEFVQLCKYVGVRQDWVQAGGGNISVKRGDVMYIKSSGCTLFEVSESENYQELDWGLIKEDVLKHDVSDIMAYSFNKDLGGRASIESAFHSLTRKYTVHIHPQSVLAAMSICPNDLKKAFPDALFIPYIKPGNDLAYELAKYCKNGGGFSSIVFLENHGVIIHSNSFLKIWKYLDDVTKMCEKLIHVSSEENNSIQVLQMCEAFLDYSPYVLPLDDKVNFTNSCPDFIVYLNEKPFIHDEDDFDEYMERYGDPTIIRFKDRDYIIAKNYTKAKQIEDIVYANKYVNLFNIKALPQEEIDKIKNWDAEKYRKEK